MSNWMWGMLFLQIALGVGIYQVQERLDDINSELQDLSAHLLPKYNPYEDDEEPSW